MALTDIRKDLKEEAYIALCNSDEADSILEEYEQQLIQAGFTQDNAAAYLALANSSSDTIASSTFKPYDDVMLTFLFKYAELESKFAYLCSDNLNEGTKEDEMLSNYKARITLVHYLMSTSAFKRFFFSHDTTFVMSSIDRAYAYFATAPGAWWYTEENRMISQNLVLEIFELSTQCDCED